MTHRPANKKSVKISFDESPDEQNYFNYWEANFSSDEEILLNGKSEVLWSRNGYMFNRSDSPQEFSDLSGRTLSSCSWHNDEFDTKSANQVNTSLEAIDDALYDKVKSPFITDDVFQECCDWAEKFPYFRVIGKQLLPHKGSLVQSASAVGARDNNFEHSFSSWQLKGKKVPLHVSNKSKEFHFDYSSSGKEHNCIAEDEEEEGEYLALHKSDEAENSLHVIASENTKPVSSLKELENKIIDKLVAEMWPKVLASFEKLSDINEFSSQFQLPPITMADEQKKAFHLQRPRTEGSSFLSTEFPKLENILNVSPKVLQQRDIGISRFTRPNSEMSVNLRVSSKPSKPISDHTNATSVYGKTDCTLSKVIDNGRESEISAFVLPSLEENFQDSSSVLRGFRIEPCKKEQLQKSVFSSRNEHESMISSRENEYFLPPIVDKNFIPTNLKLTKNLFTFYGPPVISNKTKPCSSAEYSKPVSRPSTSISKKVYNYDSSQKLPEKRDVPINARGLGYASRNVNSLKIQENHHKNGNPFELSQEKSFTLFPIVTSLTPHEDKNHSIKKGLLHSFLGVKKR